MKHFAAPLVLALVLVGFGPSAFAAQTTEEVDPFADVLFTPEEIMQYRRAIRLTDEQREAITKLIEDLQGRAVGLQWRLLDETESVHEALEGARVDLDLVMDRFGKALNTEMEIKRAHLELLIRIKNLLTRTQQEELLRLRASGGGPKESGVGKDEEGSAENMHQGVEP